MLAGRTVRLCRRTCREPAGVIRGARPGIHQVQVRGGIRGAADAQPNTCRGDWLVGWSTLDGQRVEGDGKIPHQVLHRDSTDDNFPAVRACTYCTVIGYRHSGTPKW